MRKDDEKKQEWGIWLGQNTRPQAARLLAPDQVPFPLLFLLDFTQLSLCPSSLSTRSHPWFSL